MVESVNSRGYTVYCFCFAVKKFHGLTSFLTFPEKISRLPVTLPVLGTLDSNIHGKTFAVAKRSAKTAKLFHHETKAIYGIMYTKDVSKTNQGGIAHKRREPKQVIQYANEVHPE